MSKRSHFIYLTIIAVLIIFIGFTLFPERQLPEHTLLVSNPTVADKTLASIPSSQTPSQIPTPQTSPLTDSLETGVTEDSPNALINQGLAQDSAHLPSEQAQQPEPSQPTQAAPAHLASLVQQQVTDYAEVFNSQNTDATWSYATEQQINDLFATYAQELSHFMTPEVTCRTSICQIKTEVGENPFMQLMQLQKLLLEQSWYGSSGQTTLKIHEDGTPAEVYIAPKP